MNVTRGRLVGLAAAAALIGAGCFKAPDGKPQGGGPVAVADTENRKPDNSGGDAGAKDGGKPAGDAADGKSTDRADRVNQVLALFHTPVTVDLPPIAVDFTERAEALPEKARQAQEKAEKEINRRGMDALPALADDLAAMKVVYLDVHPANAAPMAKVRELLGKEEASGDDAASGLTWYKYGPLAFFADGGGEVRAVRAYGKAKTQ